MIESNNLNELLEHISKVKPMFITIDGRDGAGKTYLSNELHKKLGGTHLNEETYRTTDLEGSFVPKELDLMLDVARNASNQPIIFDSVLMLWLVEKCCLKPDLTIYVKKMTPMRLWSDESELDDGMTKEQAIETANGMGAGVFRRQMINYHFDYLPHKNSDVAYLRTEGDFD